MTGAADSPFLQDSAAVCAGSHSYSLPYIFGFEVHGPCVPPKTPPNHTGDSFFPIFCTSTDSLQNKFALAHVHGANLSRCTFGFYFYCVIGAHGEQMIRFPVHKHPGRHGGRSVTRQFEALLHCVTAHNFALMYTNVCYI